VTPAEWPAERTAGGRTKRNRTGVDPSQWDASLPNSYTGGERKKAMAKAYKRLRRERTERRVKNQSFMEPSKRPLTGKQKKSFIRSLFSRDASEPHRAVS
jgi:hypothetical protein